MTLITQMDCCAMLGVDPKTLRHWCSSAHIQFCPHPTDGRLKCLTREQVQQLAQEHGRPMPFSPALTTESQATAPPLSTDEKPIAAQEINEALLVSASTSLPKEEELRTVVLSLQDKVMTLQEQLTQLTLELLRERDLRYEQRLSALEALLPQQAGMTSSKLELAVPTQKRQEDQRVLPKPELAVPTQKSEQEGPPLSKRQIIPAEQRGRTGVIPRVELSAAGSYVIFCPQEGELFITPDSPEWFDWLASLLSFRFLGNEGRFTAYRERNSRRGEFTRCWTAIRSIHNHHYKFYLGITDRLTIAWLEQAAATLQSHKTQL